MESEISFSLESKYNAAKKSSKVFNNIAGSAVGGFSAVILALTLKEVEFSKIINQAIIAKLLTGFVSGVAAGGMGMLTFLFLNGYENGLTKEVVKDAAINGVIMFSVGAAISIAAEFLKQKVSTNMVVDTVIGISAAIVIALLDLAILEGKEALGR